MRETGPEDRKLTFYPFDVDGVRKVETPEDLKLWKKYMEERIGDSRFKIVGTRRGGWPTEGETLLQSGGVDDGCDE